MNLFIKTASALNVMGRKQYKDLMDKREQEIIDAFKKYKTPTATARFLNDGTTRWVITRIVMRHGLWNNTEKEEVLQNKHAQRDMTKPLYYYTTKEYRDENQFQDKIENILKGASVDFEKEKIVSDGLKARCDFFGKDFIIEAKVTSAHDELCRGFGQCMIYKALYPGKRICILHPNDIEPNPKATVHIINNGIAVLSESQFLKWLI